ncbi:MAG: DUF6249 domain-containing protein [Pseudomonadota bacterium]
MESGELVGIVFFLSIVGVIAIIARYRFRARRDTQLTLRAAIDKGQPLSEDMIRSLTGDAPPSHMRDLRRGLTLLAIAIALVGFGLMLDEDDATPVFVGAALFPLLVGAAYVLMYRLGGRKD